MPTAGDIKTNTIWRILGLAAKKGLTQTLRSQRSTMRYCLVGESIVKLNEGRAINPVPGSGAGQW